MKNIIEVNNLKTSFFTPAGEVKAVNDVSFKLKKGEVLGIVGESGSGKSITVLSILKLLGSTGKIVNGEIILDGENIVDKDNRYMGTIRGSKIGMIFQDPYASLNPRMTISEIIRTPLDVHNLYTKEERKEKVKELLNIVGFNSEHGNRYPHELSGGQRQRVGIARALAVEPEFIICDEPISALDVSIQAQIINTLEDLKNTLNLTYLFIAHHLSMVKHISDNIGVMYLGNIVEIAESDELYKNPVHPYTQSLLSAIPLPDPRRAKERKRIMLEGEVPSPINPPSGCKFHTRCKYAKKVCSEIAPELKDCGNNHRVACHLINKI